MHDIDFPKNFIGIVLKDKITECLSIYEDFGQHHSLTTEENAKENLVTQFRRNS